MPARKGNELASWEVDAHSPMPIGETRVRRSYCSKELVLRPHKGVDTVHDMFVHSMNKYGDRQGFGKRDVLEVYEIDPSASTLDAQGRRPSGTLYSSDSEVSIKTASSESFESPARSSSQTDDVPTAGTPSKKKKYKLSPYNWITYNEALACVINLGSGLRTVGAGHHVEGSYFGLYGHTSRNWMMMAQACAFNAVPVCTLYDTLSVDVLATTMADTRVRSMFVNADLLPNVVEALISGAAHHQQLHHAMNLEHDAGPRLQLRLVIYDGNPDEESLRCLVHYGVKFMSIDELRQIGKKFPVKARKANRDDIFCCIWTSGGNDRQKGVLLTHGNICAAVASVSLIADDLLAQQEMYLAFLPLAHIMELVVEMTFMNVGVPIAYGSPATLTDAGVRGCKSDIMEARPTMMVAVPQVWEIMKKGIQRKVEESGGLRKSVFNLALKAKSAAMEHSIPGVGGVTDAIVFNAVRKMTGGRLRTLMNGGGSVSKSTVQFLSAAVVQMIQGYGLTETTTQTCILHPSWMNLKAAVGGPVPGVEMKLVDRLDLGYHASQNEGEVYVRGPCVFKGYFNRPDLNAAVFTEDGWFKTGDIGRWNKDGTLTVVDRVKNHVMLADGYIALERLESIYKTCGLVLNGCVLASPTHKRPAMIAVVHPEALPIFARKNGINGSLEELCANPRVVALALKELNTVAKREGLKGNEILEALVLTSEEWTPESGLLTAAQKLKRSLIEEHYAEAISKVYTISTATAAPGLLAPAPSDTPARYARALPDESPTMGFQSHSRTPSDLDLASVDSVMVETPVSPSSMHRPSSSTSFGTFPSVISPTATTRTLSVVHETGSGESLALNTTDWPNRSPRQPPSAWQHSHSASSTSSHLDFIPYSPDRGTHDSYTATTRVTRSHSVDEAHDPPSRWPPAADSLYDDLARQRAQSIPLPNGSQWPRLRTGTMSSSTSHNSVSPTQTTSNPQSPDTTGPPSRTNSTSAKHRSGFIGSPVTSQSYNNLPADIPNLTPSIPNLTPSIPNLTPGYNRKSEAPARPRRPSQTRSQSDRPVPTSADPSRPPFMKQTSLERISPRMRSYEDGLRQQHSHERYQSSDAGGSWPATVQGATVTAGMMARQRRASDADEMDVSARSPKSGSPKQPSPSPKLSTPKSSPQPSRSASVREKRDVDRRMLGPWMDDLNKYPLMTTSPSHLV